MNNFFESTLDFNYFKKAMKITDGESIIVNLSSDDSSLAPKPKYENNQPSRPRKTMSNKFEPSPFGRFFGSPKRNTAPVDMNDFTSWKNKNYRQTERIFEEDEDDFDDFSIANYMKENSGDKFNELDQAKTEIQKPIEQLSVDDPTLKKFSLDSYMHKLEESILARDKFDKNDDLLEPIVTNDEEEEDFEDDFSSVNPFKNVVKGMTSGYQDEDFSSTDSYIERFALDDDDTPSGTNYSLDQSELDKLRKRLDRIEKQAQKIKEKPTQRLIYDDGIFDEEETKEKDDLDSIFMTEEDKSQIVYEDVDEVTATEKPEKVKRLSEVVFTSNKDQEQDPGKKVNNPILITKEEEKPKPITPVATQYETKKQEEPATSYDESDSEDEVDVDKLKKSDLITKDTLKEFTDEFMSKFAEMVKPAGQNGTMDTQQYYGQDPYQSMYQNPNGQYQQQMYQNQTRLYQSNKPQYAQKEPEVNLKEIEEYKNAQQQMQIKLLELVADKNKTDKETEEKIRRIEEEKDKINEEYQNKLKEMEESYNKKYEEFKQKIILDSNSYEKKLKDAEERIEQARVEAEKDIHGKDDDIGVMLIKELKSNFNISNLEMDKKLLEITAKLESGESKSDALSSRHISRSGILKKVAIGDEDSLKDTIDEINSQVSEEEPEEDIEEEVEKQTEKTTPKKTTGSTSKTSKTGTGAKRKRKSTKTRKVDRDISGGIDF